MSQADHAITADPGTLETVQDWINAALPCGDGAPQNEIYIVFEHTKQDSTYTNARNPQGRTLSTFADYDTATRAFLHMFSHNRCGSMRNIRLFSAWNEPNYDGQPTYGDFTKYAGHYWNMLNASCHPTYSCAVAAGELVDFSPASVRRSIDRYVSGMNGKKASAWSIHAYHDAHLPLADAYTNFQSYLSALPTTSAKLWLTEQGGRYDVKAGQTASPALDECKLMRFPSFSPRITRFYHYELEGPGPSGEAFDSALIGDRDPDNGVRAQYGIFKQFSAGTGTGFTDNCPADVQAFSPSP